MPNLWWDTWRGLEDFKNNQSTCRVIEETIHCSLCQRALVQTWLVFPYWWVVRGLQRQDIWKIVIDEKSKDEYSWAFLTCLMLLLIWWYEKLCPLLFQNSELNVPENHQNVRENQITVSHLSIFWEWGFEENVKNRKCINYCKFNQKTLNTWKWSTRKNSNTCNVEQGKKIETSFG